MKEGERRRGERRGGGLFFLSAPLRSVLCAPELVDLAALVLRGAAAALLRRIARLAVVGHLLDRQRKPSLWLSSEGGGEKKNSTPADAGGDGARDFPEVSAAAAVDASQGGCLTTGTGGGERAEGKEGRLLGGASRNVPPLLVALSSRAAPASECPQHREALLRLWPHRTRQ